MSTATDCAATGSCCAPEDRDWGRASGARPPLRFWIPLVTFGAAALVLTLVVALVVRGPGPGDDPNPAEQRDGLLRSSAPLPATVGGVAFGGRPVVVLFEITTPSGAAFDDWRDSVTNNGVELVVSLPGTQQADLLRNALEMPTPSGGGDPIGYAVVDSDRRLRYSTLDPQYLVNAFEVDVITGAVR